MAVTDGDTKGVEQMKTYTMILIRLVMVGAVVGIGAHVIQAISGYTPAPLGQAFILLLAGGFAAILALK